MAGDLRLLKGHLFKNCARSLLMLSSLLETTLSPRSSNELLCMKLCPASTALSMVSILVSYSTVSYLMQTHTHTMKQSCGRTLESSSTKQCCRFPFSKTAKCTCTNPCSLEPLSDTRVCVHFIISREFVIVSQTLVCVFDRFQGPSCRQKCATWWLPLGSPDSRL
ncbi:hypothetical protein BJ741DRAFT_135953 [Chytriomyces cf. hyalinus JEL632]|nr:hypothetical protein BJ741DRAFT_135953 [Chytriomyces cf. hyalinus JEL632]